MSGMEVKMSLSKFTPGSMSSSVRGLRTDVTVDSINKPATSTQINLMISDVVRCLDRSQIPTASSANGTSLVQAQGGYGPEYLSVVSLLFPALV